MVKPTGASFFIFGTFAADVIDTKSPRQEIPITNSRSDKRAPRILLGPCIICFAMSTYKGRENVYFFPFPGIQGRSCARIQEEQL
jgi:hypothetical protein